MTVYHRGHESCASAHHVDLEQEAYGKSAHDFRNDEANFALCHMTSPGYDQEMNGGSTTRLYSGLSVTSDSDGKSPHSAPATIEPQQRECVDGARLLAETGDIEAKKRDVIARTE